MVFLVSGDTHDSAFIMWSLTITFTEQFVLFHCRIIHHRNIQESHPRQWRYSLEDRRSHQYRAVSQLRPEHRERSVMRSYPAMV